jgi:hypothetical protein
MVASGIVVEILEGQHLGSGAKELADEENRDEGEQDDSNVTHFLSGGGQSTPRQHYYYTTFMRRFTF